MIHWEGHGPYVVGFTDRTGGVSGGAYESLNLGALTEDEPDNVTENRRRACASIGADAETAASEMSTPFCRDPRIAKPSIGKNTLPGAA